MTTVSIGSAEIQDFLAGSYQLVRELGAGGFATVFRANQLSTGQPVAIKVQKLPPEKQDERESRRARFERETKLCAALNHPHVVRLLDKGQSGEYLFLVFEFVPGETLRERLLRHGPFEPPEAVQLMGQVLDALGAAHVQGVVHRDLKPENIMVVPSGAQLHAKVLDFGAGAFLRTPGDESAALTRSNEILGTPSYASPEQLRGEVATSRSDIYAWGLVLLECLTAQRVVEGATMAEIFHRQLSLLEVPLPPAVAQHPLGEVLRRTLRKSPAERPSDARRLWVELQQVPINSLVTPVVPRATSSLAPTAAVAPPQRVGERRQVTALCASLGVRALVEGAVDAEILDTLERDQLSLCRDIIARFGGYLAGMLGNRILAVFGLPWASDNDARRAARAALELAARIASRGAVLSAERGVDLDVRIGIHTGFVIVAPDGAPSGPALNLAVRLEGIAKAGTALVSSTSHALLQKYWDFEAQPPSLASDVRGDTFVLLHERSQDSGVRTAPGTVLVGRDLEVEALSEHWARACAGDGGLVLLRGEPGVGKSRLALELRTRASQNRAAIWECRCLPEDKHTALHPVTTMLRQQLPMNGANGEPSAFERALERCGLDPGEIVPILRAWLPMPDLALAHTPPRLSPQKQKLLLLDAVAKLLCFADAQAPRLVIIEDVHWSDPTTRELLAGIGKIVSEQRALVLLTARPDFEDAPGAREIALGGLSRAAAEELVARHTRRQAIAPDAIREIIDRADGVPLFLEELTRSLAEVTSDAAVDGSSLAGMIPNTLRDLLLERLDRLQAAKRTAQLAAAIGREFSLDLLSNIADDAQQHLQEHLVSLLAARIVHGKGTDQSAVYEFRHALIHEAALESMLPSDRRVVHYSIATALERGVGTSGRATAALLAWHFEHAERPQQATHYRLAAGTRAAELSAYQEALEHFGRAEALVARVEDAEAKIASELELCNAVGAVLIATQGLATPAVVKNFTRADQLMRLKVPSPEQRLATLKGLWTFHNARADYAVALRLSAELLEFAAERQTPEAHLVAYDCAGQTALLTGSFEETLRYGQLAEAWLDPALQRTLAVRHGIDPGLVLQSFASIADVMLGNVGRAQQRMAWILEVADKLAFPSVQASMLGQSALIEFFVGSAGPRPNRNMEQCSNLAGRAGEVARQFGFAFWAGFADLIGVMAGVLDGDPALIQAAHSATQMWRLSGAKAANSWHSACLALGQFARKDFAAARGSAEAARDHCAESGELYGESEALRVLGLILAAEDNPQADREQAQQVFEQSLASARRQGARWLELRAAYSYVRQFRAVHEPAASALHSVLAWFDERGEAQQTALVQGARVLLAEAGGPSAGFGAV